MKITSGKTLAALATAALVISPSVAFADANLCCRRLCGNFVLAHFDGACCFNSFLLP